MKDEAGVWQENEYVVQQIICNHFVKKFNNFYPNMDDIEVMINGLEPRVTSIMNEELLADFCVHDAEKAVKEMHPALRHRQKMGSQLYSIKNSGEILKAR